MVMEYKNGPLLHDYTNYIYIMVADPNSSCFSFAFFSPIRIVELVPLTYLHFLINVLVFLNQLLFIVLIVALEQ